MLILFYSVIILLTGFACLFFIPWIGAGRASLVLSLFVCLGSYSLYKLWGNDLDFNQYYALSAIRERQQHLALRARLVNLSKAEYALRVRLERVPDAPRLNWQLEDLLAQRAMLAGAWREAYKHWQVALLALSKDPLSDPLRTQSQQKIEQMMTILKPFMQNSPNPPHKAL
ncbi:MAG: hypothetical protein KBD23_00845 [Gammaproteobacteria bacterium]|nr:hypothetical protein [Gammaproteobacteria bacterium]MBP9728676.1 hypothetical protein [Gammaproteobacteria bacterium]